MSFWDRWETYIDAVVEALQNDHALNFRGGNAGQAHVDRNQLSLAVVVLVSGLDVDHARHALAVAEQFVEVVGGAHVVRLIVSVHDYNHFI